MITLGVNTLLALLLKRPLTSAASRTGRLTEVFTVRPQLRAVDPPPQTAGPTVTVVTPGEFKRPGIMGDTDPYGNIRISNAYGLKDQMTTEWHEEVHSAFTPKAQLLRRFRASLNANAYQRSVMLRYLEEALAETRALIKATRTFEGGSGLTKANLIDGMKFPLKGPYWILAESPKQRPFVPGDLGTQGSIVGSIIVDGDVFHVRQVHGRKHGN